MQNISDYPPSIRMLVLIILGISLVFVLIKTQQLLAPLLFAVLFAYLLYPTAQKMEENGIPRIITNLILILGTVVILAGSIVGLAYLFATFTENLPEIQKQLEKNLSSFQERIGEIFGFSGDQQKEMMNNFESFSEYFTQIFTSATNTIVAIGLIPVYTFLLLFYRDKFRTFVLDVTPKNQNEVTKRIVDQASRVVPKYLKGLLFVVLILMVVNSLGFYLIGIQYALLFGVIAALFNLIPYLGTVLGYAVVLLFVLATQPPSLALYLVLLFLPVQFFENNILTPNITGSYVHINPLVVIISLIASGMVWGLPGMFLVIPYLAMFKIVCENVESLKPIGYLIGTRGTEEHLPSLEKIRALFRF